MYFLLSGYNVGSPEKPEPIGELIGSLEVTREAKTLLQGLTHTNPTQRLSATEALHDHWITGHCHGDEHDEHLERALVQTNKIDRKKNLFDQTIYKDEDIPLVHSEISVSLTSAADKVHAAEMKMGEVNDDQLLAEVARRRIDVHHEITEEMVKDAYEFGQVLGEGASGKVFAVTKNADGNKYACKFIQKGGKMNDEDSMNTEVEILKRLKHVNVLCMVELFESPQRLWMIMELANGGTLPSFVGNEVHAAQHFRQILLGIHYLHSQGIT